MTGFEMRIVLRVAAPALSASAHAQTAHAPTSACKPASPDGNAGSIPPNKPSSKDIAAAFGKADANHDGRLDSKEVEKFPPVVQRFDVLDAHHDGFVSRDELATVSGS